MLLYSLVAMVSLLFLSKIFNCSQISSMRDLTLSVITIGRPHSRSVSPGHLLVASSPILNPAQTQGSEVEIIYWCVFHHHGVTGRIHPSCNCPDNIFPVRALISSSQTITNLVYMNWRRYDQTPIMTLLACPAYCFHCYDGKTIRAPFRRKIKINNFRKLFLKNGNKDFV